DVGACLHRQHTLAKTHDRPERQRARSNVPPAPGAPALRAQLPEASAHAGVGDPQLALSGERDAWGSGLGPCPGDRGVRPGSGHLHPQDPQAAAPGRHPGRHRDEHGLRGLPAAHHQRPAPAPGPRFRRRRGEHPPAPGPRQGRLHHLGHPVQHHGSGPARRHRPRHPRRADPHGQLSVLPVLQRRAPQPQAHLWPREAGLRAPQHPPRAPVLLQAL
ncbi:MAG: hypothetical protein AVDCRST_MAG68-4371, partial [uncultured Gemmatimonadetes bacterium]